MISLETAVKLSGFLANDIQRHQQDTNDLIDARRDIDAYIDSQIGDPKAPVPPSAIDALKEGGNDGVKYDDLKASIASMEPCEYDEQICKWVCFFCGARAALETSGGSDEDIKLTHTDDCLWVRCQEKEAF